MEKTRKGTLTWCSSWANPPQFTIPPPLFIYHILLGRINIHTKISRILRVRFPISVAFMGSRERGQEFGVPRGVTETRGMPHAKRMQRPNGIWFGGSYALPGYARKGRNGGDGWYQRKNYGHRFRVPREKLRAGTAHDRLASKRGSGHRNICDRATVLLRAAIRTNVFLGVNAVHARLDSFSLSLSPRWFPPRCYTDVHGRP